MERFEMEEFENPMPYSKKESALNESLFRKFVLKEKNSTTDGIETVPVEKDIKSVLSQSRLTNKEWSTEGSDGEKEAIKLIEDLAKTLPVALADKYENNMKLLLQGATIFVQPCEKGQSYASYEYVVGRQLYQGVQQCINKVGNAFAAVVNSGLDIANLKETKATERLFIEEEIRNREENANILPTKISPEEVKAKVRTEIRQEQRELHAYYKQIYDARIREEVAATIAGMSSPTNQKPKKTSSSPGFQKSIEGKECRDEQERIGATAEERYDEELLAVQRAYELSLQQFQKEKKYLESLKSKSNQEKIVFVIASTYTSICSSIAEKVEAVALEKHAYVAAKLRCRVKLPNGEIITDPLSQKNLAGLKLILYNEYAKTSLSGYIKFRFELQNMSLSEADTNARPELAISEIEKKMHIYESAKFGEFETKDIKFTCEVLRMLHAGTKIKEKLIEGLVELAKKIETKEIFIEDHDKDMPFFTKAKDIINLHKTTKESSRLGGLNSNAKSSNGVSGGFKSNKNYPNASATQGTESAASANVKNNNDKGGNNAKFSRFVTRDENLMFVCKKDGKPHLYTATENPCSTCLNPNREFRHKPPCLPRYCATCLFFGHNGEDCRQTNRNSKFVPRKKEQGNQALTFSIEEPV